MHIVVQTMEGHRKKREEEYINGLKTHKMKMTQKQKQKAMSTH